MISSKKNPELNAKLSLKRLTVTCPVHGSSDAWMQIVIHEESTIFCLHCYIETLQEMGLKPLEFDA